MLSFFMYLFITLFIVVSLFLIMVVLIQKGRGGGLASAFGGAGGNTAFGAKTGDVLTWVTSVVFGVFLFLAIGLNLLADSYNERMFGPEPEVESVPFGGSMPQPVQVPPAPTESPADSPVGIPSPGVTPPPADAPAVPATPAPAPVQPEAAN